MNKYADLTNDEFRFKHAGRRRNIKSDPERKMIEIDRNTIAEMIDWRIEGGVNPV